MEGGSSLTLAMLIRHLLYPEKTQQAHLTPPAPPAYGGGGEEQSLAIPSKPGRWRGALRPEAQRPTCKKAPLKSARALQAQLQLDALGLQGNAEGQEPRWPRPHFLSEVGGDCP